MLLMEMFVVFILSLLNCFPIKYLNSCFLFYLWFLRGFKMVRDDNRRNKRKDKYKERKKHPYKKGGRQRVNLRKV